MKFAHEHEEQHDLLLRHLISNGDDSSLPKEERGIPFRSLLIKTRLEQLKLADAQKAHIEDTAPLIVQYKQDLKERDSNVN